MTNPRLRIPPPRLQGFLASGSCLEAPLRAPGCGPARLLLEAWIPTRVTRRPLDEKGSTPSYGIPVFRHSLHIFQRLHPSHSPSYPFTCILCPSPPICTLFSTPHNVHAPPSSPPLFSLLYFTFLSYLLTPTYSLLFHPTFPQQGMFER